MTRPMTSRRHASIDDVRPASANYHANALARGLALLELLAAGPQPQTLNDFSDGTGLPKSTLVRLLSVLTEMDYVVRADERPSFRLGYKVQGLATAYIASLDLSGLAGGYLASLAKGTGQTANLGVLDGEHVLHVCVIEPNRPLRFTAATGSRDHAYCTGLGKLLMSRLDPSNISSCTPPEPFPAFTDNTITNLDQLSRELRRVARRGYALDDNERSIGLRCVAVPIELDGECLAAVSVSGPSGEFTPAKQEDFVELLTEVAGKLAADEDFGTALRILHRTLRPVGSQTSKLQIAE